MPVNETVNALPGRKILLDTEVYCPYSRKYRDVDPNCDHDFDAEPTESHDDYAVWKCTRCGMTVSYEVWD